MIPIKRVLDYKPRKDFIIPETLVVGIDGPIISGALKQAQPKQDALFHGITTRRGLPFCVVIDGHGYDATALVRRNTSLAFLCAVNWSTFLDIPEWPVVLVRNIKKLGDQTNGSGSTFSVVLRHPGGTYDLYSCGDSYIKVINASGNVIHSSPGANYCALLEELRIATKITHQSLRTFSRARYNICSIKTTTTQEPCATRPMTMNVVPSAYFLFEGKTGYNCINVLDSLGHGGYTKHRIIHSRHYLSEPGSTVIVATDGIWDVICAEQEADSEALIRLPASEIMGLALERWTNAKWTLGDMEKTFDEEARDDIALFKFTEA